MKRKYVKTFEQYLNNSSNNNSNGVVLNIKDETLNNRNYRKVLYTASNIQLVVMSLEPGEEIGEEVHESGDQFIRIESGKCKIILNEVESIAEEGFAIIIEGGTTHNIINIGDTVAKIYTVYSPPEHPENTKQLKKE